MLLLPPSQLRSKFHACIPISRPDSVGGEPVREEIDWMVLINSPELWHYFWVNSLLGELWKTFIAVHDSLKVFSLDISSPK